LQVPFPPDGFPIAGKKENPDGNSTGFPWFSILTIGRFPGVFTSLTGLFYHVQPGMSKLFVVSGRAVNEWGEAVPNQPGNHLAAGPA